MLGHFSCVQLFATLWTVTHQAHPSMGLSRQEYWSVLPHPPPGDLPHPETELTSACISCIAAGFFTSCSLGTGMVHWPSGSCAPGWVTLSQLLNLSGLGLPAECRHWAQQALRLCHGPVLLIPGIHLFLLREQPRLLP